MKKRLILIQKLFVFIIVGIVSLSYVLAIPTIQLNQSINYSEINDYPIINMVTNISTQSVNNSLYWAGHPFSIGEINSIETDPRWEANKTTVPYLALNNIFTGQNNFSGIATNFLEVVNFYKNIVMRGGNITGAPIISANGTIINLGTTTSHGLISTGKVQINGVTGGTGAVGSTIVMGGGTGGPNANSPAGAGGAPSITGGTGGAVTYSGVYAGSCGTGGGFSFTGGGGGVPVGSTSGEVIGGAGGSGLFTGGAGAIAVAVSSTTNRGGNGGGFSFVGNSGGGGFGGTSGLGGAGGNITFQTGAGGAGSTSSGASGEIVFKISNTIYERINTAGNILFPYDNQKLTLGTGNDATIYFNGTAFVINPSEVGTQDLFVLGNIQAYKFIGNGSLLTDINITANNLLNQNCPYGKFVNGTMTNGTIICTTTNAIYETNDLIINHSGIISWTTLYNITLVANTNYTIDCYMVHSSNATTSGIRYNLTLAGNPDWMIISQSASTSGTAVQRNVISGTSKSAMPTAVTGSLAYPTFIPDELNIFIDGNANTGGYATFQISGELAGLLAVVGRGSYCVVEAVI